MYLKTLILLITLITFTEGSLTFPTGSKESNIIHGEILQNPIPYQVCVITTRTSNDFTLCGGSLITKSCVLTAAHCIPGADKKAIPFGEWTAPKSITYIKAGTTMITNNIADTREADSYLVHDNYTTQDKEQFSTFNDIALYHLNSPFQLSKTIKPIKIATTGFDVGTICQVSGYGLTNDGEQYSNDLYKTDTILKQCTNITKEFVRNHNVYCAVNPGAACKGDSGGPLVCNNMLAGIVSSGYSADNNGTLLATTCSGTGGESIYTNVSSYIEWIKKNVPGL